MIATIERSRYNHLREIGAPSDTFLSFLSIITIFINFYGNGIGNESRPALKNSLENLKISKLFSVLFSRDDEPTWDNLFEFRENSLNFLNSRILDFGEWKSQS